MPATKTPRPRKGKFMGMTIANSEFTDGSWLEGEEFCYPKGGWTRFAYATCEDDIMRRVQCTIPDTFFSIPAKYRQKGKLVKGFLSIKSEGENAYLAFTEYKTK